MKFSSQEEYGLRCLLRLGIRHQQQRLAPPVRGTAPHASRWSVPSSPGPEDSTAQSGAGGLTIPEIARLEGISVPYVAKMMRVLRTGGLVTSARGAAGGYVLARPPEQIAVGEALAVLGGRLYEPSFCEMHSGEERICTHSVNCSLRSLWRSLQLVLDQVLDKTSLRDLLCNESEMTTWIDHLVTVSGLATVSSKN
ncbi:MAG: Rrf2 family transcriptional regulator [Acidobacteria bacterium]|nr:MAG: Rrf2 family transcriptional regulator [Acidobacteriota bacterium]